MSAVKPRRARDALSDCDFREFHERSIAESRPDVWNAMLAVAGREVRALGPLLGVRSLPRVLRHGWRRSDDQPVGLLDQFVSGGFLDVHRNDGIDGDRSSSLIVTVGRFWSPAANAPRPLADYTEFTTFEDPGFVKVAIDFVATDDRSGATCLTTETRVRATDARARRRFAAYWALIRLPSGLIRRSILAAVDRRATCHE